MVNLTSIFYLVIILLAIFVFSGCPGDDGVRPKENPLQLTVEDFSCTETILKLSLSPDETNRVVTLKRDDSLIAAVTMLQKDSLFFDENLLPGRTYTYTLLQETWSVSAAATTQDTTSHDEHWMEPDTLGVYGYISDVWAFSKNDAWAVGEIYLADSSGTADMEHPYNAAHWDGRKWEILQIPTAGFVGSGYYPIYTIFAFAPNDIWTFSEAGSYSHWNGQTWTTAYVTERQGGGQKLWGTSASNLFLVGTNGSISKYNGNTWTKQESHTTVDLQDIWGIDDTHVWATGTNVGDGHCVVLQYDGKQWTTIYDNTAKPPNEFFGFRSLWTNKANIIYLSGDSKTRSLNLFNKTFLLFDIPAQWVALRIRGIRGNDIFEARSGGEVTHFNGIQWHLYSEIKNLNGENTSFTTISPKNDFILIGGFIYTGLNGIPVVVRGYR